MSKGGIRFLIPGLMIASELLLLLFVGYWLVGQYNSEKLSLKKELKRNFIASQDQVMDSLLFKHFIKPYKKDSTHIIINVKHDTDDINILDFDTAIDSQNICIDDSIKSHEIIAISISDSSKKHLGKKPIVIETQTDDQMLTRSVKLFVSNTGEQLKNMGESKNVFPFPMDSVLLKKVFSERLTHEGLDFDMVWVVDSINDKEGKKQFVFKSDLDKNLPMVQIEKYKGHVLRLIFPEIAFALFLLLLTGFAFYFTYHSLVRQQKLGKMREAFIGNITHELKTPVSTMKVALEAILGFNKKTDEIASHEYIQMAQAEANRLDKLINHILTHSKLEANKEVLTLSEVKINSLVKNVIESMKFPIEQKEASLFFSEVSDDIKISIDSAYVESVLRNLIDNSLKYCSKHPSIKIEVLDENTNLKIQVKDNGPGIPEKYLPQVFDKFFRVPKGDTHNVKGYGLGLSFAQLIMELHRGTIAVKNLDKGCAFTLIFPKN